VEPFLVEPISQPPIQSPRQPDRNASPVPLVFGVILTLASVYLLWSAGSDGYVDSDPHDIFLRVMVYVLTPFSVVFCMIIDIVLQGRGMSDPSFFARPRYSVALRVIVLLSFVIAVIDINTLAKVLADLWS